MKEWHPIIWIVLFLLVGWIVWLIAKLISKPKVVTVPATPSQGGSAGINIPGVGDVDVSAFF